MLAWLAGAGARADDAIVLAGVHFPAVVDRLTRAEQTDWEARQPGLGVQVGYHGDNVLATVQVYDKHVQGIPGNPATPIVRHELDAALDEIQQVVRAGRLKAATVRRRYEITGASSLVLYIAAQLSLTQGSQPLDSFVFVTTRPGKFFKVRYTTTAHDGSAQEAEHFALSWIDGAGR
jgi:hypothetical protein